MLYNTIDKSKLFKILILFTIGDTYYIITPVMVHGYQGPVGMLGKTKDFETYEPIDIITAPQNRGASLFPEKINGKYYKLDRLGPGAIGGCDIWISASELREREMLYRGSIWGALENMIHKEKISRYFDYWQTDDSTADNCIYLLKNGFIERQER